VHSRIADIAYGTVFTLDLPGFLLYTMHFPGLNNRTCMTAENNRRWARPLLGWYRRVMKPLPWRLDPAPYRVWVGEVMSQQTTLGVVVPRFEAFTGAIPDVRALASCRESRLRRLWAGLGYYARARNLRRGARIIVEDLDGRFPESGDGWLSIPGCGPYTAAMIASMCFGEQVPAVDGNVTRVASRLLALRRGVWSGAGRKRIRSWLAESIPASAPGDFNQALMELGQEVCGKREPACSTCPVRRACLARERGIVDKCPPPRPRRKPVDAGVRIVVVTRGRDGRTLLGARTSGFLARTVGFPIVPAEGDAPLRHVPGADVAILGQRLRHTITHHRITGEIVAVRLGARRPADGRLAGILGIEDARWIAAGEIMDNLSSSLDRKAWKAVS
jgi:A/G-specific adenine glycosylase